MAFMELDLDRMKKDLSLETEAKKRGERNSPPSDAEIFDDIENMIITTIESEKRSAHDKLINHFATYGDRIRSLGFQTKFSEALTSPDFASCDFKTSVQAGKNLLFESRRNVGRMEKEFETFKKKHGLRRLPSYPHSWVLHFSVPISLLLVEAILNGNFLAIGHELGLIGGILEALAIAAVNVGVGLSAGLVIRQVNHRVILRKLSGVIGLMMYFAVALGFNLAVAHYRDALGGEFPIRAAKTAIDTLLASPLAVADLKSWMLLLMGCCFSLACAVDSYKMDDPYPGYGKLARRQLEIMDEYIGQTQDLMKELELVRDQALLKMEIAAKDIDNRHSEYRAILASRQQLERTFEQYVMHLEDCANQLLSFYRETNRSCRQTPTPKHFSQKWEISHPRDGGATDDDYLSYPAIEEQISQVFSSLHQKREKVLTDYEAAVFEYRRIEQLTEEALQDGSEHPAKA